MPFWILLEFEEGENNGNTRVVNSDNYSDIDGQKKGVVFFGNKQKADDYRKRMIEKDSELVNYQVVGLDDLYWKVLKSCLKIENLGMIYVEDDSNIGICNRVEQFDYLRMSEMRKR